MMRLKTRLLAGASSLAMAGAMVAVAAPTAHASPTAVGSCVGSVSLLKSGASTFYGSSTLGDQTATVRIAGNLAKDMNTKAPIAGNCSGSTRPGDLHIPDLGPLATLTPRSAAFTLVGNASCANSPTAQAADANAASAWQLGGTLRWTFTQMYTDLLSTTLNKLYTMRADVTQLGSDPLQPDVFDIGGIVTAGVNASATVSGTIWEDPVTLTGGPNGYNTGYEVDLADLSGCADDVQGNANITALLSGGGGSSTTSLLGSTATGLTFSFGE